MAEEVRERLLLSTLAGLRTGSAGRPLNAALDADVDAVAFDLRVPRDVALAAILTASGDVEAARSVLLALTDDEMASLDAETPSLRPPSGAERRSAAVDTHIGVETLECTRRECRRRKERIAALEQAVLAETLRCDRRVFEVENATSAALRRLEGMLRAAEELAAKRGADCERVVARANALHVESSARGSSFDDELFALRKSLAAATLAQSSLSEELGAKEARIASLEERVAALSASRAAESQRVVAEQASRVRELEHEVKRSGVRAQLERERALSAASLKILALQSRLRETEARVVEAERRIELWEGDALGQSGGGGGSGEVGAASYTRGVDVERLAGEASGGAVWT
jgi:hypothetical protein